MHPYGTDQTSAVIYKLNLKKRIVNIDVTLPQPKKNATCKKKNPITETLNTCNQLSLSVCCFNFDSILIHWTRNAVRNT